MFAYHDSRIFMHKNRIIGTVLVVLLLGGLVVAANPRSNSGSASMGYDLPAAIGACSTANAALCPPNPKLPDIGVTPLKA